MGIRTPTISDSVKWLMQDKDRLSLFLEIAKARTIKKEVDMLAQQLLDQDLIRNDKCGLYLTERGVITLDAVQALFFIGEI